jgi:hypothetical protein
MDLELLQYLAEWIPDAPIGCQRCSHAVALGQAIQKEQKVFCSERCAEIATAPMIRPQPKRIPGVNFVDGWDV